MVKPRSEWWVRIFGGLIGIGLLLALPATAAEPGFLDLAWEAPTTNVDGTLLTDLAGYRVYWGLSPGNTRAPCNTNPEPVGNETIFRLEELTAGTIYFVRVIAVDTSNNPSPCSNEASGRAQPLSRTTAPTTPLDNNGRIEIRG